MTGIFWTLLQGGELIIPSETTHSDPTQLAALIEHHQVSHVVWVPSLYHAVLGDALDGQLESLRVVITARESLPLERVPADNPFVGRAGVLPEIYSYGHRNAQGMAVHPVTGDLWQNEHGPQGGDELNLIRPGLNYVWPVVGFGVNYTTGKVIHEGTLKEDMEPPVHVWVSSIGVSGLLFYTGDRFPGWKGDMLVAGLSGQRLMRLRLDGQRVAGEETLIQGLGRLRDVQQGPDGLVYVAVDGNARGFDGAPTPIVRLVPAARR